MTKLANALRNIAEPNSELLQAGHACGRGWCFLTLSCSSRRAAPRLPACTLQLRVFGVHLKTWIHVVRLCIDGKGGAECTANARRNALKSERSAFRKTSWTCKASCFQGLRRPCDIGRVTGPGSWRMTGPWSRASRTDLHRMGGEGDAVQPARFAPTNVLIAKSRPLNTLGRFGTALARVKPSSNGSSGGNEAQSSGGR